MAEEKINIINPKRAEIDTSPPFESVKEAVHRFGGSGPWIPPHHLPRLATANHDSDHQDFDMEKIEEQTMQLKRDLNQAKSNLNKTSTDLAIIQQSVEFMNKKMRKDKFLLNEKRPNMPIQDVELLKEANFEVQQFKKMTEASRYEVMKAMAEIERTKNSIKMAEMRINAAKKMEEAAKAVEAIALVERSKATLNEVITLSFEEYRTLTRKAQQAEDICKTKFIDPDAQNRDLQLYDEDELVRTNVSAKFKFRNSDPGLRNRDVLNVTKEKSRTLIGNILSRKLILENNHERGDISLSQMLREQSRVILHPNKTSVDGKVEKQYRKKFGFIQVPIPMKQSKKKTQSLSRLI
ncbi:hypothetical protein ACJIZ3_022397 [Penstemon smallii]|uniref:Uncharacterized protein n=1 Tax=Penstemon smallii TaxID=265156 RepID=A0ABD3TMG8_9LAMI